MDRKSMWHAIHTSETGRLENLDQLTPFGKELLYTFVHLLLQGYNGQTLTELLKTYQWLENNPNVFDVSQRNVQRILSKYVSNNDCPENNFSSAILPTNGPCTDYKLTKAKECEATLKWKLGKKANGKENKNPNPSCYFSQFENPSIAMNESNQKTPKTPFTSNKKKPLQQSDLNTPKNVNSIQIPRRLAVPSFASPNNPMNNLPTLHLYSHIFDTSKNIAYQLGSRIRTMSGKTSKEEKALEKRIKNDAKERPRKKCDHCKKDYCGYTYLFSHVKNNEACRSYYKHARKWEKLEEEKKKETKSYQKSKAKSEAENALEEAKKTFTFKFKQVFKHAINQVKVSGHGATVSTYFFIILQKL